MKKSIFILLLIPQLLVAAESKLDKLIEQMNRYSLDELDADEEVFVQNFMANRQFEETESELNSENLPSDEHAKARSGLLLIEHIKVIHQYLKSGQRERADEYLDFCKKQNFPEPNIFKLLPGEAIIELLESADHNIYVQLKDYVDSLLQMITQNFEKSDSANFQSVSRSISRLSTIDPQVMDHSIREPATNTPFGHTAEMKYLSWKLVREGLGVKNIALAGLYYGDTYTVEEQFIQLLHAKEGVDAFRGGFLMSGPSNQDRKKAFEVSRKYGVPNLFLDVTTVPTVRFDSKTISQVGDDIISAVAEADTFLPPLEEGDEPMGQIYVNLVDLMECVNLQFGKVFDTDPTDLMLDKEHVEQLEMVFARMKSMPRIKGILFEEGRGRAIHTDYAIMTRWLRQHFPEGEYTILVHAHGGTGNEHSASIDSVNVGADGVWSSFIPQAALVGHNSYFQFLDNLISSGNEQAWDKFDLHTGVELARALYSLNFNTASFPADCPVWGKNHRALVHTAFNTINDAEWRSRPDNLYHQWTPEEQVEITTQRNKMMEFEWLLSNKKMQDPDARFRIAPLVTDPLNIGNRLAELKLLRKGRSSVKEAKLKYGKKAQQIMFATMNAGIRVNYNNPETLKKVFEWANK